MVEGEDRESRKADAEQEATGAPDADAVRRAAAEELTGDARLAEFTVTFAAGELIFEQGDPPTNMYFIKEGRIRITKISARRAQPLAVLTPGTFFGEMAVLNDEPRTARAEALEDAVLLAIDGPTLREFLREHPDSAFNMIQTLAHRLRETDELVLRVLEGDPVVQVVETLLEIPGDAPAEEAESVAIDPDLDSLMVRSGTSSTELRLVLTRLKRGGFIRVDEAGKIRIIARRRLTEFLNFLPMQQNWLSAGGSGSGADDVPPV